MDVRGEVSAMKPCSGSNVRALRGLKGGVGDIAQRARSISEPRAQDNSGRPRGFLSLIPFQRALEDHVNMREGVFNGETFLQFFLANKGPNLPVFQ